MSDTFADSVEGTPGLTEEMREALGEGEQRPCRHCGIRWADWPRSLCPQCLGGHKIPPDPGLMKAHKHNQTTETYPLSAVPDLEVEPDKTKRGPKPKQDSKRRVKAENIKGNIYRCLSPFDDRCEQRFFAYKNGAQTIKTICEPCLRARQERTRAETRKTSAGIKHMLELNANQHKDLATMVNDGTGWKPVPMEPETKYVSRQELAKAATHVENVALTIDFTGREELLEALKKQAFCMCRKPEEQILWTMTINLLCDHEEG